MLTTVEGPNHLKLASGNVRAGAAVVRAGEREVLPFRILAFEGSPADLDGSLCDAIRGAPAGAAVHVAAAPARGAHVPDPAARAGGSGRGQVRGADLGWARFVGR